MSDMIDTFKALQERGKARRAKNRDQSPDLLRQHGIAFTDHNLGAHLIVEGPQGYIDFWPGTGRWNDRTTRKKGFGVGNLIAHIKDTA